MTVQHRTSGKNPRNLWKCVTQSDAMEEVRHKVDARSETRVVSRAIGDLQSQKDLTDSLHLYNERASPDIASQGFQIRAL